MARVSLDRLRKVYDDSFTAVHDATFESEDGAFVVLEPGRLRRID